MICREYARAETRGSFVIGYTRPYPPLVHEESWRLFVKVGVLLCDPLPMYVRYDCDQYGSQPRQAARPIKIGYVLVESWHYTGLKVEHKHQARDRDCKYALDFEVPRDVARLAMSKEKVV